MRRTAFIRTVGVLAVCALVVTGASAAQANPDEPVPDTAGSAPEVDATPLQQEVEAAVELRGDIDFSVPGGTFQGQLSVALSTDVAGAEIRYTTNGQLPTGSSSLYTGPINITRSTQLRAQPFAGGQPAGDPGTAVYVAQSITTQHDLPVLIIDSYGRGLPNRQYYDSAMVLHDTQGGAVNFNGSPEWATKGGFRLRGNSSAEFDKRPYRVELWDNDNDDARYPILGMPAESDWVLRGPFSDKALIRDSFVYELGREMGLLAPRHAFVEVYVNGGNGPVSNSNYEGVYMISETLKNRSHRLDLSRLRGDRPEDRVEPRVSGAYIWSFEWLAAEEPRIPCRGPANTCWTDMELSEPHPTNHLQPEMLSWITNHLNDFQTVLNSSNFADPQTGYRAWIDVDSWVDQMIIAELSRDMDAYVRSAYFHKDRGEKIAAGPLWDYDLTFGVGGFFENNQIAGWQWQQARQPQSNNWYNRLMQDPAFVDDVRRRWAELRQPGNLLSDQALTTRVRNQSQPLGNAAQRNFQKFPNLSSPMVWFFNTPTAGTWQGQVDYMLDWMLRRAAWLDSAAGWNVAGIAPGPGPGPTTPGPGPTTPGPGPTTPGPGPTTPGPGPGPGGGCTASYTVVSEWGGGFQANVDVTAGSAPINGWTVSWSFANGQTVTQAWGATVTGGTTVTATNESWNGALGAGATASFGFVGSLSGGTNSVPTLTCTAG